MERKDIESILELHRKWLYSKEGGECADLSCANLSCADLSYANLSYADLSYANLSCADLHGADLSCANLSYADLSYAKNAALAQAITEIVPREGSFDGWKKARYADGECIVRLRIPKDAQRSNATGRKCRCSKALVLSVEDMDGNALRSACSDYDNDFVYKVGETVEVEDFDADRFNECATGIHFFLTPEEARAWRL